MSDIEQRLRGALTARAELVRPEDLTPLHERPLHEPPAEEPRRWWQHPGAYLIAAAVAVIVLALPLLVIAATDDGHEGDPVGGPSPSTTEVSDPERQVAAELFGDVDGDGDDETVTATHTSGDAPAWSIEVELSSTGATVSYYVGQVDGVALTRAADVDGRTGDEILIVVEPGEEDPHRGAPTVLGLRDGELVPIVAYEFGAGGDPAVEGAATYWWLRSGELWWWRSQAPVADDEDGAYAVDVVRFRHGVTLTPEEHGTRCVTPSAPIRLLDCDEAGVPSGSTTDAAWWEQHPDGLPAEWSDAAGTGTGWLDGDVDGDGAADQVRVTGSEGNVDLQVELADGRSLTAPLPGPTTVLEPLATLVGSPTAAIPVAVTEGAAGTTYTTWHVYLVRDGELVEASAPDLPVLGSQVSNLTEAEGGTDSWRTWVDPSGALVTMSYDDAGTPIDDPDYPGAATKVYRNTVYRWLLEGTTLVASALGEGCTVRDDTVITACP